MKWPKKKLLRIPNGRGFETRVITLQIQVVARDRLEFRDLRVLSPALWPLGHDASPIGGNLWNKKGPWTVAGYMYLPSPGLGLGEGSLRRIRTDYTGV